MTLTTVIQLLQVIQKILLLFQTLLAGNIYQEKNLVKQKKMTNEEMQDLFDNYKRCRDFLKADRSLQKQGVYGFIPSQDLPSIYNFVKLFEEKVLG